MYCGRIRENTDHNDIRLHPVERTHRAFRGAFRRIAVRRGNMYSHDPDIVTQVLYGEIKVPDWKRLVIVKEALHVFDPEGNQINTPDAVRRLIPAVISPKKGLRRLHQQLMIFWVPTRRWPFCCLARHD